MRGALVLVAGLGLLVAGCSPAAVQERAPLEESREAERREQEQERKEQAVLEEPREAERREPEREQEPARNAEASEPDAPTPAASPAGGGGAVEVPEEERGRVCCCDGTVSPTCTYVKRGCCSHHGGVCACP